MFERKNNEATKGIMNQIIASINMVNDQNFTYNKSHMSN